MQVKGIRHEGYHAESLEILIKANQIQTEQLTGAAIPVVEFDTDDTILDVILLIEAANGTGSTTIDVGFNAAFTGGSAEGDAIFNNAAIDVTTPLRLSQITASEANTMRSCAAAGGAITVTPAGDYSASDFQGELIVLYVKR